MGGMEGVFLGFDIAASGLRTELARAEIVAANVANAAVTRGPDGLPYRRRTLLVEEARPSSFMRALRGQATPGVQSGGTRVTRVMPDMTTDFQQRHDPGHPHADRNGFVAMSNVDVVRELVDMTVIQRSYEANLATMQAYRGMLQSALQNLRI